MICHAIPDDMIMQSQAKYLIKIWRNNMLPTSKEFNAVSEYPGYLFLASAKICRIWTEFMYNQLWQVLYYFHMNTLVIWEIDRFFQIFMQNKMISLPLKLNFLKLKLKVFWYFQLFMQFIIAKLSLKNKIPFMIRVVLVFL